MPFHPVLEAFGGNLKIVGTGASTANQHMPHFADDAWRGPRLMNLSNASDKRETVCCAATAFQPTLIEIVDSRCVEKASDTCFDGARNAYRGRVSMTDTAGTH